MAFRRRPSQVARQTVQDDFQILVDTLLGSWLPAWKRKPSVKQILHPKFYWFDPGVARQVAGTAHLAVHPEERGFLFESYLLHELRAFLHYRNLDLPVGYWARRDGAVGPRSTSSWKARADSCASKPIQPTAGSRSS